MKVFLFLFLAFFLFTPLVAVFADDVQQKTETDAILLQKKIKNAEYEVKSLIGKAKELQKKIDESGENTACEYSFGKKIQAGVRLEWFSFQNFLFAQTDHMHSRCFLRDLEELEYRLTQILATYPRTSLACSESESVFVKARSLTIQKELESLLKAFDEWNFSQEKRLEEKQISSYEKEACEEDPQQKVFEKTVKEWKKLEKTISDIMNSPLLSEITQLGKEGETWSWDNALGDTFSFSDDTLARLQFDANASAQEFWQETFESFDFSGRNFTLRLLPLDKNGNTLFGIRPRTERDKESLYKQRALGEMRKSSPYLLSQMASELLRREEEQQRMWENYMQKRQEIERIVDYGHPFEIAVEQSLDPFQKSTKSATQDIQSAKKSLTKLVEKQAKNIPLQKK